MKSSTTIRLASLTIVSVVLHVGTSNAQVTRASWLDTPTSPAPSGTSSGKQAPSAANRLEGTSWQLVKFQGGDDSTVTPDDGSKYTIAFASGGQLTARIDCNRGRGTWKSSDENQLQLGPLALTRAFCGPGSLHDRLVKHWSAIRSYVIKDGHLFLSLMADGGIYEFEPLENTKKH